VFDVTHIWIHVDVKTEADCSIVILERICEGLVHVCRGAGSRDASRPPDSCELWGEVPWLQERRVVHGYVTRIGLTPLILAG
jgi:hypothetical protein